MNVLMKGLKFLLHYGGIVCVVGGIYWFFFWVAPPLFSDNPKSVLYTHVSVAIIVWFYRGIFRWLDGIVPSDINDLFKHR